MRLHVYLTSVHVEPHSPSPHPVCILPDCDAMCVMLFLQEAAVREVREETGLELKATSLLVVENPSADWFRFTFTGRITGTACQLLLLQINHLRAA